MNNFKPMLAAKADLATLRYPVYASPKLDGIRATVIGGKLLSRKLIEIPNKYLQHRLGNSMLNGLDGELVVGPAIAKDCFRVTTSGVMSIEGTPDFNFFVFDLVGMPATFERRLIEMRLLSGIEGRVQVLEQRLVLNQVELDAFESECLGKGYEGIILRDPQGAYKFGRSTAREGGMLKVKRFEDSEARVVGVIEEMHNGNAAETDNLGRTKRSSHKANLAGKGTMGALRVRDLKTGVEFNLGTGFTAAERAEWWAARGARVGWYVKYQYFPVGVKDLPRHPRYVGIRDKRDL